MTSKQKYISNELFHFVGRKEKGKEEQYNILKNILSKCSIGLGDPDISVYRYDPNKKLSSNELYDPDMVCFCDIPISEINIHMIKYSAFGISFKKNYLITKGANPVWYISSNSQTGPRSIDQLRKNFEYHDEKHEDFNKLEELMDKHKAFDDDNLKNEIKCYFSHIYSFMKFFDAELDDIDEKNFYMEREWRICGVLNFETIENVNRVILPKEFISQFKKDFPNYNAQINFSDDL